MNTTAIPFRRVAARRLVLALLIAAGLPLSGAAQAKATCDSAGLTLPEGFCATVFADKLGQARHLAAAADGTVYVNTWRSPYRKNAQIPPGGYLVALKDTNGDGVAEKVVRFGEPGAKGAAAGGTGIAVHDGKLYAEATGRIVRYTLPAKGGAPTGPPEVVLDGLPTEGGHNMHPFAITPTGALLVNSGSATNVCQAEDRKDHTPGKDPCDELATRAGIWKYDAGKTGQKFSSEARYASGLRNSVAVTIDPSGALVVVPHGRDQLHDGWPERFTAEQGSELPAEAMYRPEPGADYGWPYCYYDGAQGGYFTAPEYGGDGKKTDRCAGKPAPLAVFPGHWAPDGILFYTGTKFPERYHRGAFIAFHGSWNRAGQQQGYNVVFQPMDAAGKAAGRYEVFADGFAGAKKTPAGAAHRPTGIAMGPDGALYVSDDQGGRVYRIVAR